MRSAGPGFASQARKQGGRNRSKSPSHSYERHLQRPRNGQVSAGQIPQSLDRSSSLLFVVGPLSRDIYRVWGQGCMSGLCQVFKFDFCWGSGGRQPPQLGAWGAGARPEHGGAGLGGGSPQGRAKLNMYHFRGQRPGTCSRALAQGTPMFGRCRLCCKVCAWTKSGKFRETLHRSPLVGPPER